MTGSSQRACQANGAWSGTTAICNGKNLYLMLAYITKPIRSKNDPSVTRSVLKSRKETRLVAVRKLENIKWIKKETILACPAESQNSGHSAAKKAVMTKSLRTDYKPGQKC